MSKITFGRFNAIENVQNVDVGLGFVIPQAPPRGRLMLAP